MKDSNGKVLTEKELINEALNHLSDAMCFLYETESDTGHAFAWMVDAALKYGQVVMRGHNVLSAAADYTHYETEVMKNKNGEK